MGAAFSRAKEDSVIFGAEKTLEAFLEREAINY